MASHQLKTESRAERGLELRHTNSCTSGSFAVEGQSLFLRESVLLDGKQVSFQEHIDHMP